MKIDHTVPQIFRFLKYQITSHNTFTKEEDRADIKHTRTWTLYTFNESNVFYHHNYLFFNIWIYHNYMFFMTNCLHLFDTINSIAVDIFFSGHTARLVES